MYDVFNLEKLVCPKILHRNAQPALGVQGLTRPLPSLQPSTPPAAAFLPSLSLSLVSDPAPPFISSNETSAAANPLTELRIPLHVALSFPPPKLS